MIKNNLGAIVLILLICGLSFFAYNLTNKDTSNDFEKALADSLKTWRDKDSLHNASISSLEADRKTLLEVVDKKDKEILELLNNPKVKEVTKIKIVTKLDSVLIADSIGEDCRGQWEFDNGWISADIRVHRDTLEFKHLTVKNELLVSHEEVNNTSVIHIKQQNPYTSTLYIKDYVVAHPKAKKNRWLKNLLIGIGVGVATGLIVR